MPIFSLNLATFNVAYNKLSMPVMLDISILNKTKMIRIRNVLRHCWKLLIHKIKVCFSNE